MSNQTPTSTDYENIRAEKSSTKIYMDVFVPQIVFSCRVAALPTSNDMVKAIAYDRSAGDLTSVVDGATIYIGSSPGAFNKGVVRATGKTPTDDHLYIGETSSVVWAVDDYVSVTNDLFGIWARPIVAGADGSVLVDGHQAYTNQHQDGHFRPVVNMLTHAVAWIDPVLEYVDVLFDTSDSWIVGGGTLGTRTWYFPGSASVDLSDPVKPIARYDTAGNYVAYCMLVNAHGEESWGYRAVFIHDTTHKPVINFSISGSGDWAKSGWRCRITVFDRLPSLPPNALVVVSKRDYYNGVEVTMGPVQHRENILLIGNTKGADVISNLEGGQSSLTVYSPDGILNTVPSWVSGYLSSVSEPTKWTYVQGLNPNKLAFVYLSERTNLLQVCDVQPPGNETLMSGQLMSSSKLWSQLVDAMFLTIRYSPRCDRFGRLFIEPDANVTPPSDRSTIPIASTFSDDDYSPDQQISIGEHPVSKVLLSGVYSATGEPGSTLTYYSLSPGHSLEYSGDDFPVNNLVLVSQSQSNELAGMIHASENLPFMVDELILNGNNPFIDICPRQRVDHSLHADRNPYGLEYSGHMLPRQVSFSYLQGSLDWSIALAPEVLPSPSVNGDIPPLDPDDEPIEFPVDPPDDPDPPDIPDSLPTQIVVPTLALLIPGYGGYYTDYSDGKWFWRSANLGIGITQKTKFDMLQVAPDGTVYLGATFGKPYRAIYACKPKSNYAIPYVPEGFFYGCGLNIEPIYYEEYAIHGLCVDPKSGNIFVVGNRPYPQEKSRILLNMVQQDLGDKAVNDFYTYWQNPLAIAGYAGYFYTLGSIRRKTGPPDSMDIGGMYLVRVGTDFTATFPERWKVYQIPLAGFYQGQVIVARNSGDVYLWDSGNSILRHFDKDLNEISTMADGWGSFDCDPTGQYLMWTRGSFVLKYSSDYGVTWTDIHSYLPDLVQSSQVVNLGTPLKWVVSYFSYATPSLQIMLTEDGGLTWTSIRNNIFSLGVPVNGYPTILRRA
jgi:hypothetical protein